MKKDLIQSIFLYICALIGVIMMSMGAYGLLNMALEKYVFQVEEDLFHSPSVCETKFVQGDEVERTEEEIEECEERQRRQARNNERRRIANDVAFLIIGTPLFFFGWRSAKKVKKGKG